MSTHTPGPWKYEESTKTIRSVPSNHWLASMDSFDGTPDHDANARLIAAAPRMLALIRTLDTVITTGMSDADKADLRSRVNAILRDVEGESNG